MSKKWWIIVAVVVVVGGLGFAGYQYIGGQQQAQAEAWESMETAVVRRDTLRVTIDATGSLAPQAEVSLAFASSGLVTEVFVEEGQQVEAGQPLAQLDTDDLALQVTKAEISLREAELQLETLLEPPYQADIEKAQDTVDQAAASLQLAQIDYGTTQNSVAANETLEDAQSAYEEALHDYDYWLSEYNEHGADYWFVDKAQEALDDARLALNRAQQQASQQLQSASNSLGSAADIYRQAQNDLKTLLAGADESDVEAAHLQVDQDRAALEQARLQLEQAALTAPMAGTVTALNVQPGEMASAGQAAVVVISDLSVLVVEVNLDETDVAQVVIGQEALVSVDAFPDAELTGEVAYIALVAETQSGVVLYPVTVRLSPTDPSASSGQGFPVRAGMTADVEIITASQENALLVPLRAVHTEGGQSYVNRLSDHQLEQVEVELGLMTDTEVEIASGLAEGDVVIVVAGPSQDSPGGFRPPFMGGGGH